MAKYKGREVTIDKYPAEEYSVVIVHADESKEQVRLGDVTLTKSEAVEFLKQEQAKLKASEERNKVLVAEDTKKKDVV